MSGSSGGEENPSFSKSKPNEISCIYEDEYPFWDCADYTCALDGPTKVLSARKTESGRDLENSGEDVSLDKRKDKDDGGETATETESLLSGEEEYDPKQKPYDGPTSRKPTNYFLQVWRPVNISLALSFFTVGLIGFASTALSVYLIKDRNASSIQLSCMGSVVSLPWAMKIFIGIFSDGYPLLGYRRKPLILFGNILKKSSVL